MSNRNRPSRYYNEMVDAKSKEELANEIGFEIPKDGYWGNVPSRLCGLVGGALGGEAVRKAVEDFEMKLR